MAMNGGIFFGPTNLGGSPIDMPTFVRPFSPEFSRSTNHRIPSIFCMKLVCSKSKKTKPDFQIKIGPNLDILGPNLPKFEVWPFSWI